MNEREGATLGYYNGPAVGQVSTLDDGFKGANPFTPEPEPAETSGVLGAIDGLRRREMRQRERCALAYDALLDRVVAIEAALGITPPHNQHAVHPGTGIRPR